MAPKAQHDSFELDLFHNAEPLHTHGHCKNCFRMRRCEGPNNIMPLLRCSRCCIATYCSKACQKAHWRAGHKSVCDLHHRLRERATAFSGNPNAWPALAAFIEFHHATLVNCVLANFLRMKPGNARAAAEHIVHFSLRYRNAPALPAHRQFEPRGVYIAHRDEAARPGNDGGYAAVWRERELAVEMGRRELGSAYAATGAYYLVVKFGDGADGGAVPFWKHFGIDDFRWNALPSVRKPWDIFKETIEEGKKMKFCCGQLAGLGTCCCGGWTHTPGGRAP